VLFSVVIMIDRSSRSQPGSRSDLLSMYDGRQNIKKQSQYRQLLSLNELRT